MQIGVVFPQTELGGDVGAVRAYGQAVEELGFGHVLAYDHVLGADPAVHQPWRGPYDVTTTFHEPFVLFGYLAALTTLELVTGVIILPQRQTALVAKQAAEVDLLTGGRFRLGVGVGWNPVEYEALGQRFDRARSAARRAGRAAAARCGPSRRVTFDGEFDMVTGAGLSPMPIQQPIPIWFGGQSEPAYRRIGRLADGWFPQVRPGPDLDAALEVAARAGPAGTSRRPAGRCGGRRARTGRRTRSGSAAAPAAARARPPVTVVELAVEGDGRLGPEPAQQPDLLVEPRGRGRSKRSPSASYSTGFQPMPTPRRNRPPVSRSTSAACLATSAVWRCGRMMTPVTSSRSRERGEVAEQHERLVEGRGRRRRARATAGGPPGRRRARGRRRAGGRSRAPRPPAA